jgi:hypothetical protein
MVVVRDLEAQSEQCRSEVYFFENEMEREISTILTLMQPNAVCQ